MKWISMRHPKTGGVSTVTAEAFDLVHSKKGWVIIEDDVVAPEEIRPGVALQPDPPASVDTEESGDE